MRYLVPNLTYKVMKLILTPTDFSEYSAHAAEVAAGMAGNTGAEVVLLHCIHTLVRWDKLTLEEQQMHPDIYRLTVEAENKLHQNKISLEKKGVKVRIIITHGMIADEIAKWAHKLGADLIIMGSHGKDESDKKYFIGSNLQKTLREAECPVLSIKRKAGTDHWQKLIFAATFDENIRKPFEAIRKVAADLKSKIQLVYINTPGKFKDQRLIHEEMDAFIANYPEITFEKVIYNHTDQAGGILRYAHEHEADWIAMIMHNHRHSPDYLIGVTESVVYHGEVPVLSISE